MNRIVTTRITRQRGAALVVALLMLLVMTVLGLASMQVTRMEEKMAGNARDVNLAFQGAEAGLREAEERLRAVAGKPTLCASTPCASGFFASGNLVVPFDLRDQTDTWWRGGGLVTREYGTAAKEITGTVWDPWTVTEELMSIPDTLAIGETPPPTRGYYRVTSWSSGASPSATVVLETTTGKRYN